jgi:hypothetical protein
MKKTRSFRITEKSHERIINEAKAQRRSVGETLDIIIESYFEPIKVKEKPILSTQKSPKIDYLDGFSIEMQKTWGDWLEYKFSIKNGYKTDKTEAIAIANLAKQCQGNEQRMINAIYHSIGNNYKGIYEQTNNNNKQNGTLTEQFVQKIKGAY